LDEADHMLDLGFIDDIRDLMHYVPRTRQTLFFSATISEEIKKLAYSLVHSTAIRIQISPKDPVSKNVGHAVAFVEMDDKRFFLERFINEHPESKILVFVRTKVRAERVLSALARVGLSSQTIHGGKDQKERSLILEAFRTAENKVLIATDVSARGIDIPNVDYVINYDLPDVAENYVHRVGRTGRGVAKGIAISFCSPEEKAMLDEIQTFLGKPIDSLEIDKAEYRATLEVSGENANDWRSVIKEIEEIEEAKRKKGKKKKK
jgi:ATP-dependent RNA helicase RhlE